jgi:anti-sigma regulatory factor (Ser/Thr protein kinase)
MPVDPMPAAMPVDPTPADAGAYEWDARSGALTWSPQLYRVLGRDAAAGPLQLADLPALVRPSDVAAGARAAGWLVEHGRTVDVTCPVRIRGRLRHLHAVAEPVHDPDGRLVGVRGVVRDVTDPGPSPCRWRPAPDGLDEPAVDRMTARLQALVVPAQPPPVTLAGLRVERRYLPAAQAPRAGGDWFHTAVLADGRVLLAVGDVAGHGLAAAAAMVNLCAWLAALSAQTADPANLAAGLNRILLDGGEDRTASALLACWDPVRAQLTWAQAGHPGPVLRRRGRPVRLPRPAGMVLGSDPAARYEAATTPFGPGDAVVLYTDGLLGSPAADDDRVRGLARALSGLPTGPPSELPSSPATGRAGAALPALLARLPAVDPGDDACVLLAYPVTGPPDPVPGPVAAPLLSRDFDRDTLDETRDAVLTQGAGHGLADLALYNFTLAVTEVVTNAVRHGGDRGHLSMWRDADDLVVEVADRGNGIPAPRRAPTGPRPGQVGGWGLWLTRQICSSVTIDSGPTGTRVRLRYPLPTGG